MSEWNLKDYKQMWYHHMMEEVVYPEDKVDILMEKLIEKHRNKQLDEREIMKLFGEEVDTKYMREFWKIRTQQHKINEGMTNLEDDMELLRLKLQKEIPKMVSYVNPNKDMHMLDLGSGYGTWTFFFANNVKHIDAVDYTKELVDVGIQRMRSENITNIDFCCNSIQQFISAKKYDMILLSGICIYLNDADIKKLMKHINDYTKKGSIIVLRDGTGLNDKYIISKEYSERLKSMYSAMYRTREEYIDIFKSIGFELIKDEDMFEEGSPLNRYKETRLRIYKFRKA